MASMCDHFWLGMKMKFVKPLFVINCMGRMAGRLVVEEYCESGNILHTMPGLWSTAEQTHALRRVGVSTTEIDMHLC